MKNSFEIICIVCTKTEIYHKKAKEGHKTCNNIF